MLFQDTELKTLIETNTQLIKQKLSERRFKFFNVAQSTQAIPTSETQQLADVTPTGLLGQTFQSSQQAQQQLGQLAQQAGVDPRIAGLATGFSGGLKDISGFPKNIDQLIKTKNVADLQDYLPDNRPPHQRLIEKAQQAGDYKKVRAIIRSVPKSDPYKKGMMSLLKLEK